MGSLLKFLWAKNLVEMKNFGNNLLTKGKKNFEKYFGNELISYYRAILNLWTGILSFELNNIIPDVIWKLIVKIYKKPMNFG